MKTFLTAVAFLTRFPVPAWVHTQTVALGRSMMFFPLVGAILGGITAAAAYALTPILPRDLVVVAVVILPVVMTGALHYDGLADTVDAMGGGFTRERRLEIMKDPHIGTYGVIALVGLVLTQAAAFRSLRGETLLRALVVAPSLARAASVVLAFALPYARLEGGKGRIFAENLRPFEVAVAVLTGVGITLAVLGTGGLIVLPVVVVVTLVLGMYFRSQLGGITGDTLGATVEACETAVYIALVVVSFRNA